MTANQLLDLEPGIGQVRSTVQWEVLDWQLHHEGWTRPLAAGSVETNTGSQIKRQLQGFIVGGDVWKDLNPFEHRIRPWWVLEDGTRWPLGVYVFTDAARTESTTVSRVAVGLMDQSHILDQGLRFPFGLPTNGSIGEAISELLDLTGITERVMPASPSEVIADPPNWPAGTSKLTMIGDLCNLAGWLPPYFDNRGLFTIRQPPDVINEYPDHIYRPHRVRRATLVANDRVLDAPNVYVVTCTGPTKSEITAVAEVAADLPFSIENRHYEVVSVTRTQGLTSTQQAQKMADALAVGAAHGYRNIQFDGPPDPRHDLYQTVDWAGTVYRETAWTLKLGPGGPMTHTLTLGGFARG